MTKTSETLGGLHILTDHTAVAEAPNKLDLVESVAAAVDGGASVIQLRYKNTTTENRVALGRQILPLTRGRALFLVNDDIEAAIALDADGVHVGQRDRPASEVRRMIGEDMILGVSAYNLPDALRARQDGADYVGVLVFDSASTKPDAGRAVGVHGLRNIAETVGLPVVGIGGIKQHNVFEVIHDGQAVAAAVIGDVLRTRDPRKSAQQFSRTINAARLQRVG